MRLYLAAFLLISSPNASFAGAGDGFPDGGEGDRNGVCAPKAMLIPSLTAQGYNARIHMTESGTKEGLIIFDNGDGHYVSVVQWEDGIYCVTGSGDYLKIFEGGDAILVPEGLIPDFLHD
jgi:hypothetical protein